MFDYEVRNGYFRFLDRGKIKLNDIVFEMSKIVLIYK